MDWSLGQFTIRRQPSNDMSSHTRSLQQEKFSFPISMISNSHILASL